MLLWTPLPTTLTSICYLLPGLRPAPTPGISFLWLSGALALRFMAWRSGAKAPEVQAVWALFIAQLVVTAHSPVSPTAISRASVQSVAAHRGLPAEHVQLKSAGDCRVCLRKPTINDGCDYARRTFITNQSGAAPPHTRYCAFESAELLE